MHKTLHMLKQHFNWLYLKKDMKGVCDQCITCNRAKSTQIIARFQEPKVQWKLIEMTLGSLLKGVN